MSAQVNFEIEQNEDGKSVIISVDGDYTQYDFETRDELLEIVQDAIVEIVNNMYEEDEEED